MRNPAWSKVEDWMGDKDEPLSGFSWAYGSHRHTTGIIIWSDVFLYDAPNGDKIAILLMDTQGLFDHKSSPTENARIFSLSTLMSSMQIYNLTGHIHENELQYLQFATDLAKFVTEGTPFQNLMFLIRDWPFAEEYAYGLDEGQLKLDEVLKIEEDQQEGLKSLRQYIHKSFDKISCFLMPHPGENVTSKKTYDGRWSQIKPEFVEQLKTLVDSVLSPDNLVIKTINGEPLRAEEFYSCILQYVEMYKSGDVPEAQSIYEANVTNHMKNLVAKAMKAYNETLHASFNQMEEFDQIYDLHAKAESNAYYVFESTKKLGTEVHKTFFLQTLSKELTSSFAKWKPTAKNQVKQIQQHKRAIEKADELKLLADAEALKAKKERKIQEEKFQILLEEMKRSSQESKRDSEKVQKELAEVMKLIAETKEKEENARAEAEKTAEKVRKQNEEYEEYKRQKDRELEEAKENKTGFWSSIGNILEAYIVGPIASAISNLRLK